MGKNGKKGVYIPSEKAFLLCKQYDQSVFPSFVSWVGVQTFISPAKEKVLPLKMTPLNESRLAVIIVTNCVNFNWQE